MSPVPILDCTKLVKGKKIFLFYYHHFDKRVFEWDGRHVLSQVKGLVKYKFVFQVCYKDLTSHGKEIALD